MLLCRDCLGWSEGGGRQRCLSCGSPRTLRHAELTALAVAHVDCDAFYAAVEKRDDPSLRDKPVIVGGGRRGVVSTACYIARTFGVRSAMPMFKALSACPHAVVIKPDMEKYAIAGRRVREMMRALTPLVEPLSIDEAFLDLTGTSRVHGAAPAAVLARFARDVEREVGITVSIGLSHNKFLAKVASDLDKPKGFSIIGKAETLDFLAPRPVGVIWGVGKAMQERLARDGIRTIADLRLRQESDLFRAHGAEGGRLYRLARGIDTRPVKPERETKSVSAETTFNEDIRDFEQLLPILWDLAEKVHRRLKAQELAGVTVTLKLKTADFRTITRSRTGRPRRSSPSGSSNLRRSCWRPKRGAVSLPPDRRRRLGPRACSGGRQGRSSGRATEKRPRDRECAGCDPREVRREGRHPGHRHRQGGRQAKRQDGALAAGCARRRDLPLPFPGRGLALLAEEFDAGGAAHALLVSGRLPRNLVQRRVAAQAIAQRERLKPMAQRHALVEHEAAAIPAALRGIDLIQIGENAALEMQDLLEACVQHEARRLLAADAARAEHGHLAVPRRIQRSPHPVRNWPKRSMPGSSAPSNVPKATSKAFRVSTRSTSGSAISAFQSFGST